MALQARFKRSISLYKYLCLTRKNSQRKNVRVTKTLQSKTISKIFIIEIVSIH